MASDFIFVPSPGPGDMPIYINLAHVIQIHHSQELNQITIELDSGKFVICKGDDAARILKQIGER